jgi:hypothetical protein
LRMRFDETLFAMIFWRSCDVLTVHLCESVLIVPSHQGR